MKFFISILVIQIFAITTIGQTNIPKFTDYPAKDFYKGKNAPVIVDANSKFFKTRLRWATKNQKPNFAGRYILTFWGCGTSCVQGAAIDAKTGKVYFWGFSTVSIDAEEIVRYNSNSRLIIFHGLRDEKDGDDGDHFYQFDGKKFIHIKSVLKSTN